MAALISSGRMGFPPPVLYQNQQQGRGESIPTPLPPYVVSSMPSPSDCLLRRCDLRGCDQAELLHHTQLVSETPVLHDLAVGNPPDVNLRPARVLAGCGNALELTLLCAPPGETVHELVPYHDLVLDRVAEVGEGGPELGQTLLEAFPVRRGAGIWGPVNVTGGKHLVNSGQVPRIESINDTTAESHTLFCCHAILVFGNCIRCHAILLFQEFLTPALHESGHPSRRFAYPGES